jgi:hypothetical protein
MNTLLITLIPTIILGGYPQDNNIAEDLYYDYVAIVDQAIYNCPKISPEKVDSTLLWELVKIEAKYKPPKRLRGMLLAAACHESKYNPKAVGDFTKKRKPRAEGIVQQWRWVEKYGVNRFNPDQASDFWMKHITSQLKSVKRECKFRSKTRLWIAAWVKAIRYPKASGRCYEKPLHLRILKKWKRTIKKDYSDDTGC